MAQDFRIMAPDQVRAVTVSNVSQSVALDVNIVNAAFTASVTLDPIITVTSSFANPVWVTGTLGELSASVTFPPAVTSSFTLNNGQSWDVDIAEGLQGASVLWLLPDGAGSGSVWLSNDAGAHYSHGTMYDLDGESFVGYATFSGLYQVTNIVGAKKLIAHYQGIGQASGTICFTYAPFTGHVSGTDGTVVVTGGSIRTYPAQTLALTANGTITNAVWQLAAINALRIGATIANDSRTAAVYVKLGASASLSSYNVRIPPRGYYEVPWTYIGVITATTSGTQTALVNIGEVMY